MITLDTNLLVYAHRKDSPFHSAVAPLVARLRQSAAWGIPWPCVHEFLGVVTNPRAFAYPSTLAEALGFIDTLFASHSLHLLAESPGYFEKLKFLCIAAKLKGGRVHDARVAAICLHHGVNELWTADRDFAAFPQLKTRNPLLNS